MNDYSLPNNWVWTTLGEISTNPQYGYTTSASNQSRGPKFLRITDLSSGSVNWDQVPYCADPPEQVDKYLLSDGDILIARSGSVGKAYLVKNPPEAVFASYLIRFRPLAGLDKYIEAFLQTSHYFDQIVDMSSGNTIFNVNATKMQQIKIPLAPLNEQNRIVAEIEARFSQLDSWLEVMQRLREQLPRLRASILKAAVEGRLVEQDPEDESAEILLQRILAERRAKWEADYLADLAAKGKPMPKDDKWKAGYPEPIPPETMLLPELPNNWTWVSLDQLSFHITSGSRGWAKYYSNEGSLFVRVGNFREADIHLDIDDVIFVNPPAGSEGERTRLMLDDLLITITASVGMAAVVDNETLQWGDAYINQHVALIRLLVSEIARYIALVITSEFGQQQIREKVYGQTKDGLNLTDIRSLSFPFPPLSHQQIIVEISGDKLSVIDKLDSTLEKNIKRANRMRQAMLKQAFEGRLVEQDPNDEPASELLKRIREERARRAEEKAQEPRKQRIPKMDKVDESPKSLYEVLKVAGQRMSPDELFKRANFRHEIIDNFYEELRREVNNKRIISRQEGLEVFLEAIG